MSERRQAQRTRASGLIARVRPGHRVFVLNVSTDGALFDVARPLRPGSDIELQFDRPDGHRRISAVVVRCAVSAIDPQRGPTYRAAVSFHESCGWVREVTTPYGQGVPTRRSSAGSKGQK